ncbi:hypothetical protein B0H14DRAFT_3729540 [Mycena olivaceomarginata]|nr:hypothetical protein B0H14DRAFT_3729540 [Mycena olivaceomarginata]
MGSSALVDKLTELHQVTRSNLDQNSKKGVLANLTKEPLPLTARWHLRWTAFRRRLGRRPRKTAWLQQAKSASSLRSFLTASTRRASPTVSALLHLFRFASSYQPGYDPLFIYNFTLPPPNFSVGDAVPASVVLPGTPGVVSLNGKRLSQLRSTPFGRTTVVLEGVLDEQSSHNISTPVVVKLCFISEHRQWRESIVVDDLYTADPEHPPAYAPKTPRGVCCTSVGSSPSLLRACPCGSERQAFWMSPLWSPTISRSCDRKLKDLSAAEFLTAAEQLFEAILDAFRRRVLHRDVSINNILLADNQLLLVDWELGGHFEELLSAVVRGTVTGRVDTMSVASLRNDNPLPHDDIESAVYVLLKALTQTFVPPVDQHRKWAAALRRYNWDGPLDPSMVADLREGLWTGPSQYIDNSYHFTDFRVGRI